MTARAALRGRLPRAGDDEGSILMLMLAIVVSMALGALILAMVINQDTTTRFDSSRLRALNGAQAGVDVMLGQIRTATAVDLVSGTTYGNSSQLPCGTLTGSANGTGTAAYSVSVDYYLTDPNTTPAPTKMKCVPGYGPADDTASSHTPRYALITSSGCPNGTVQDATGSTVCASGTTDQSKGRTITTTYIFQTSNSNIAGGQIRIYPSGSSHWCMAAGSATPAVGAAVVLAACSTTNPPAAQQSFAYRADLSIQLVSSVTASNPYGLCLDSSPTAHAANVAIVLNTCAVEDPTKCTSVTTCAPWNQEWSLNGDGRLVGTVSDHSGLAANASYQDSYCITVAAQGSGTPLLLQSCNNGNNTATDITQTWVLSSADGPGAAGASNNELVNYLQFANCLDVTAQDVSKGFLILYNCKQDPNPKALDSNQLFTPSPDLGAGPTQVLLKTVVGNSTYCLTSPTTAGGYPYEAGCPSSATPGGAATWTVNESQDASGATLPYSSRYTIVNSSGLCLGLSPNTDLYTTFNKAIVATCDGSTGQKWNANALVGQADLTNTHEN